MKQVTFRPDEMPPGRRELLYGVFGWLNRNVVVLRGIGALLRLAPDVAGSLGMVARAKAVKSVLLRQNSFSNGSHGPNLVAGEYLIGMDPGPTYHADKALLHQRLSKLNVEVDANREARTRVQQLQPTKMRSFDLLDDYLIWVVFQAMKPLFGAAIAKVAEGSSGSGGDEGLQRQYLLEARYIAGQLLGGSSSTLPVRRRAEVCADALQSRMKNAIGEIAQAWGGSHPSEVIERNAVGLAWVSHPVTTQSAALVVQELLQRPKIYDRLRALTATPDVWSDASYRTTVREHVLELMRFRPIFPLLARSVPRDTEFETGGADNAPCAAGSQIAVWSIAALFDSRAVPHSSRFDPGRDWRNEKELRYLMFGYGERQCPAKDYAVEIITSAVIGLLSLPKLRLARGEGKAIVYEGPLMARMRLGFD